MVEQVEGQFPEGVEVLSRLSHQVAFHDSAGYVTYRQARDRVYQMARVLRGLGLGPGGVVAFSAPTSTSALLLLYAINHIGSAHLELPVRLPAREQAAVVRAAGAHLLITDSETGSCALRTLLDESGCVRVISLGPVGSADGLLSLSLRESSEPFEAEACPDQVMALDLTGGTTEFPKTVARRFLDRRSAGAEALFEPGAPYRFLKTDRLSIVGREMAHRALSFGGSVHSLPAFDAGEVVAVLERERITHLFVPPRQLRLLLECPALPDADLSSLRCVVVATAPAPASLLRAAVECLGEVVHHMYGQTECDVISVLVPADYAAGRRDRLGTCGRPVSGVELSVRDEAGQPVSAGRLGAIWARTPWMMAGYWQRPDLTGETFRDGWVHTRDVGSVDQDGFLTLVGRDADAVVLAGGTVHPREVEDRLGYHPAVREAVAYGASGPDGDIRLHVAVVLNPDAVVGEAELQDWVRSGLPAHAVPSRALFVEQIPVTHANKPDRLRLRSLSEGGDSARPAPLQTAGSSEHRV